jgi:small-conductance mechanosensitive channel
MRKFFKTLSVVVVLFLCIGINNDGYAQHKKAKGHHSVRDSLRRAVLKRDSLMRTFKQSDNSLNDLLQKIEAYNSSYNQDLSDYSQGFDTLEVSAGLPKMEKRIAVLGTLLKNEHSSSLSYLFTIRDLFEHFNESLDDWGKELTDDNNKLEKILKDADEFKTDSAMHTVPSDSSLSTKYLPQILAIQNKWGLFNLDIQKSLVKIGLLQNKVTSLNLKMFEINDRIDRKIHDFSVKSVTNEYGFIWEDNPQLLVPIDSVLSKTTQLNGKLLKYFFDFKTTNRQNSIAHIAYVTILILLFVWFYFTKRKLIRSKDDYENTLEQVHYIVKKPFISALLITTLLGLYFYDQPPFIFLEILFLMVMGCIGGLIKPIWPRQLFNFWTVLFGLLFVYAITNLFTQVSIVDRILVLGLSIIGTISGYLFLKLTKNQAESYPPHTRLFVILYTVIQIITIILNLIGRFSLAKILGVATVFDLALGFGFYLAIQIIMEGLFLQLEANKNAKKSITSYLDFKILQRKFKSVLVKIALVLWFVELFENLYIDDYIYSNVGDFLNHPYKFGNASLSIGSLFMFIFVLWISIIISRIISYFYDFAEQQSEINNDFKKTRTSILLIRLSVFSLGFIAAITISGIPLSEVTIVIGALGVGIGFGLQNIVNNLVSGVILAFEKPVQVGDIIEVGSRSGVIREIGIRASKIEAGNGSEIIIPNGDLISQHVINWTLTNNNRQIELIVGVAYGSDINKVYELLKRILQNRTDLMQTPAPAVFLHNFSDSSVDFRLLFWAADIKKWVSLKSNVMIEIYSEFLKENIEIPHPKRDIQVYFPENSNQAIKNNDIAKEIITKGSSTPTKET